LHSQFRGSQCGGGSGFGGSGFGGFGGTLNRSRTASLLRLQRSEFPLRGSVLLRKKPEPLDVHLVVESVPPWREPSWLAG
jgi:hypothetical protein